VIDYPVHPAANLFPLLEGAAYESFLEDVRARGQLFPIELWCGQLLDGRNRLRACNDLGIIPITRDLPQAIDPYHFVISGEPSSNGESSRKAAAATNVSHYSVDAASKVIGNGIPALASMVEAGEVAVSAAAAVTTLPAAEQEALVAAGPKAVQSKARAIRKGPPPAPLPPPRYPHSDTLIHWLDAAMDQAMVIHTKHGGISNLLKHRRGWDPRSVRHYLLPQLEFLGETITTYITEISNAFPEEG
jgi:hypothetical protein